MMPAVNYEPAAVMARIKKLDTGSFLFFVFLKKKKLPMCVHALEQKLDVVVAVRRVKGKPD